MSVHALHQEVERLYPEVFFSTLEHSMDDERIDTKLETIKDLRRIIELSMQCLEVMLKENSFRVSSSRDTMIQDIDPYMEHLASLVRKGTSRKI
jgi:hypothetical protein